MTSDNKITEICKLIQFHDDGLITSDECVVRIEEKLMADKLELLRQGKWVANWSFGFGTGDVVNTYALMEHNDWETWYYPLTFKNLVRFFWNRLMRRLGQHRWTKVG